MSDFKWLLEEQYDRVVSWNNIARTSPPTITEQVEITVSEMEELSDAKSLIGVLDAYADIFVTGAYLQELHPDNLIVENAYKAVCHGIEVFGLNVIKDCINEVLDSNDTKFWDIKGSTAMDIVGQVDRLKESTGLHITARLTDKHIVFLDSNNKVRKPDGYKEPDLQKIIDKYNLKEEV